MHAAHLVFFVAALGFMNAPYAQTAPLFPDTIKPKPEPRSKPHSKPYSTPPHRTQVEREREPRPKPRASTPEKSAAPAVKAQATRTTASPPPVRDTTLSRCDELRRRMEQAMLNEARSGDQRRAIYQEQLRTGCI